MIDSGISGDLADFKEADGTSRVTNVIANPGATRPGDDVGHGTHVAGIIAGNSQQPPGGRPAQGLLRRHRARRRPRSRSRPPTTLGNSTVLDVINALQFVVDHKDELNIKVVNLSVSSDTPDSYLDDPLDAAVEFAWHSGIVVVAAVGNRGNAADAVQYAPGNDPFVISVGATDENDTNGPSDDITADFSSRGVTQDGFAKPDVMRAGRPHRLPDGPGRRVLAAVPAVHHRRPVLQDGRHLDGRPRSSPAPPR